MWWLWGKEWYLYYIIRFMSAQTKHCVLWPHFWIRFAQTFGIHHCYDKKNTQYRWAGRRPNKPASNARTERQFTASKSVYIVWLKVLICLSSAPPPHPTPSSSSSFWERYPEALVLIHVCRAEWKWERLPLSQPSWRELHCYSPQAHQMRSG